MSVFSGFRAVPFWFVAICVIWCLRRTSAILPLAQVNLSRRASVVVYVVSIIRTDSCRPEVSAYRLSRYLASSYPISETRPDLCQAMRAPCLRDSPRSLSMRAPCLTAFPPHWEDGSVNFWDGFVSPPLWGNHADCHRFFSC